MKVLACYVRGPGVVAVFPVPSGSSNTPPEGFYLTSAGDYPRVGAALAMKAEGVSWADWASQLEESSPYFERWVVTEVPDGNLSSALDALRVRGAGVPD